MLDIQPSNTCRLSTGKRIRYYLFGIISGLILSIPVIAQEANQDTSSTGLNKSQKSVFVELKKAASDDKNTIQSIIMIGLVLLVVGIAMYLAFRGSPEDAKPGNYARTPKKQI